MLLATVSSRRLWDRMPEVSCKTLCHIFSFCRVRSYVLLHVGLEPLNGSYGFVKYAAR